MFLLSNRSHDNWKKCLFPVSMATVVIEIFFHQNHAPYQYKLHLEKWSQKDKNYFKNLLQRCIFYLIAKGSKCSKFTFFDFYCHLPYTWVGLICLTCLIFLYSPWRPVLTFYSWNVLKGSILCSLIYVLLNAELFSENFSSWLLL